MARKDRDDERRHYLPSTSSYAFRFDPYFNLNDPCTPNPLVDEKEPSLKEPTHSIYEYVNDSSQAYEYERDPMLRSYRFIRDKRPGFGNLVDDFLEMSDAKTVHDDDNIRRAMTYIFMKLIFQNKDKISVPIMHDGHLLERIVLQDCISEHIIGGILGRMKDADEKLYEGFSKYAYSLNDRDNYHLLAAGAFAYSIINGIFEKEDTARKEIDILIRDVLAEEYAAAPDHPAIIDAEQDADARSEEKLEELKMIRRMFQSESAKKTKREIV